MTFILLLLIYQGDKTLTASLEARLRQAIGGERIGPLLGLAQYYSSREPQQAMYYAEEMLSLLEGDGKSRNLAQVYRLIANIYAEQQNEIMEIQFLRRALEGNRPGDETASLEQSNGHLAPDQVVAARLMVEWNRQNLERRIELLESLRRQKQIAQINVRRQRQFGRTVAIGLSVVLLLVAYLLDRRAVRLQLRQERQLKSDLKQVVDQRTAELESRCHELETLEGIIQAINREIELPRVLQTMLEQVRVLFPQTERAAFLLWQPAQDHFEVAASVGYQVGELSKLHVGHEEMLARYSSGDSLLEGVVVINNSDRLPSSARSQDLAMPHSVVVIAVMLQDQHEGFFVLENSSSNEAFHHEDMHKLTRFREHAISAIEKAHNMAELRRINREILETQDKLVMQQKMASLGTLSAGIAHEMKNPLNFVNTLTELTVELCDELRDALASYGEEPGAVLYQNLLDVLADLEQNGQVINKHGKRANQIVQVMMEMAQGGSLEKRLFSLNDLAEEFSKLACKAMQAKELEVRVNLETDFDPAMEKMEMAPQNLSRVIINIINNAFESVVKRARRTKDAYKPTLRISTKDHGDQLELRIRDNGEGIPKEKQKQIWEHFFSTKPSGRGNIGLGLAISYEIVVEEHHGSISVESEQLAFAEFIIILPKRQVRVLT